METEFFCPLLLTAKQLGPVKPNRYNIKSKKITSHIAHVHRDAHSPPGGDRDAHKGFVPQQLPVKLLEVLELPFHMPDKLSMGQLDGVNIGARYLQERTSARGMQVLK